MTRCYSELSKLKTIEERYEYLRLYSRIGIETFGFDRWINQEFYRSSEWKKTRRAVILRDNGYDMGLEDYPISGIIIVHHMNPVTEEDLLNGNKDIFDPEFLISVSDRTHNAIHYGDSSLLPRVYIERKPYDTCPWRLKDESK